MFKTTSGIEISKGGNTLFFRFPGGDEYVSHPANVSVEKIMMGMLVEDNENGHVRECSFLANASHQIYTALVEFKQHQIDKKQWVIPVGDIVRAVWVKAEKIGRHSTWTYNEADPTSAQRVRVYLEYPHDPYLFRDYESPDDVIIPNPYPPAATYELIMTDVTWGIEVEVNFIDADVSDEEINRHLLNKEKKVIGFYYEAMDEKEIKRSTVKIEVIKEFMIEVLTGGPEVTNKRGAAYEKYSEQYD